jgi:hypothetical protein
LALFRFKIIGTAADSFATIAATISITIGLAAASGTAHVGGLARVAIGRGVQRGVGGRRDAARAEDRFAAAGLGVLDLGIDFILAKQKKLAGLIASLLVPRKPLSLL